jgi:hypothetical protein
VLENTSQEEFTDGDSTSALTLWAILDNGTICIKAEAESEIKASHK